MYYVLDLMSCYVYVSLHRSIETMSKLKNVHDLGKKLKQLYSIWRLLNKLRRKFKIGKANIFKKKQLYKNMYTKYIIFRKILNSICFEPSSDAWWIYEKLFRFRSTCIGFSRPTEAKLHFFFCFANSSFSGWLALLAIVVGIVS